VIISFITAFTWSTIRHDDPPKPKRKEIKKDTIKIDIKQQQMVNAAQGMRSLEMDSIIMQIDSLKRKK
jgi:hypothetical protein